jgi:alkylhydroperoxidase family enzyme
MNLTIHTTSTAPAESKAMLEGIAEDLGFVPNLAASTATSPTLLAGFDGLRRAVAGGALDPVLRETAGLAVGVAVDNRYGVAFHSTVLAALGASAEDLERMRAGDEPANVAAAAVYAFARELVLTRGKVAEGTIRRTAEAGLSEADVLEVVAECTFAGLVGTLDNLAGRVELDEPFRQATWSAP